VTDHPELLRGPRPPRAGGRQKELRFRIPKGVYDRMNVLCSLSGERRLEWIVRTLVAATEEGLRQFPVHVAWLRPGATIFSVVGSTYTPVAKAAGGERAWPIEVVEMPSVLSLSRQGWRIDVTSDTGGYEGRGVCVPLEDVVGEKPHTLGP